MIGWKSDERKNVENWTKKSGRERSKIWKRLQGSLSMIARKIAKMMH